MTGPQHHDVSVKLEYDPWRIDPATYRTRAGLPKSRYSPEEKLEILGGGAPLTATRTRLDDFTRLFAYRRTDAIVTRTGQGPRAWTKLRDLLGPEHVARHLLADRLPTQPPRWVGARSLPTSLHLCIDVDADRIDDLALYTIDELHRLGHRRPPKRTSARPSIKERCLLVERAFRRLGVDPADPRQVLIQRTPSGGRHYYLFLDAPYHLDQLYDLLTTVGLQHKPGEIEFFPSTR